jgi:hypothetical protein
MTDTREVRSVVEAAERAAAVSDYASAEQLLREAASLQEASLGPLHPDLANTLNNLGVVCEITEKPGDAEHFFRRACAIATAALPPDHPFVATSRKNLEDFCQSRGIAVDPPAPPPPVVTEPDALATGSSDSAPERSSHEESRPVASRKWSRSVVIALIAGGLLLTFIGISTCFGLNADEVESSRGTPSQLAAGDPIPIEAPSSPLPPAPAERGGTKASVLQPPLVAAVQLCSDLSRGGPGDWQCVSPGLPVGPGSLFFYTRVKSPTDTTVLHRWYRGDRLVQAVELPIRANTTGGFRTYSRYNVSEGAAEWRVELRAKDGVLLREERFLVR